jgi:hypothetical protein
MTAKTEHDLDRLITEALASEDEALLEELGEEPGYFQQAMGIFRGKLAWVIWVVYIVNIIAAGVAIWAIWKLFQTTDPVMTMRWALLVLASIQIGLFMKGGLGLELQHKRMLREIKRLELQLVRQRGSGAV